MRRKRLVFGAIAICVFGALVAVWLWSARRSTRVEVAPPAPQTETRDGELVAPEAPAAEAPNGAEEPSTAESRSALELAAPNEAVELVALEMSVRVIDAADGKPVEGAALTLFDRATPVAQRTDVEGVGVLELLRPGERARLRVEAPGYTNWSQEVVMDAGAAPAVALARAIRLTGRVLAAEDETPVRDAVLELALEDCEGCERVRAGSDADGAFELAPVPVRTRAVLEVRAPGFARLRRALELRTPGAELRQDVRLVRGVELAGRVEDWISGRGLGGARVEGLVAGPDGSFEGRVPAQPVSGRTSVEVVADGYPTLRVELGPAERGEALVLRLPRLAFVAGEVRDVFGQPIEGAAVSFLTRGPARARNGALLETSPLYELPEGWSFRVESRAANKHSDGAGQYRLAILPWALSSQVDVRARGFSPATGPIPPAEPGLELRADWSLRAEPTLTSVSGRVTLNGQTSEALAGRVAWRGPTSAGTTVLTNLDGPASFRVAVEPGELRFGAVLELLPNVPSREVAVRVRANEERWLALDVVAPTPPEDAIRGVVRFADGEPVADAGVTAWCALPGDVHPSLSFDAFTDARGEFELRVVDLGLSFEVVAGLGESVAARDARAGERGVELVLPSLHRAEVRVREAHSGATLALGEDVQLLWRESERPRFSALEPISALPDASGAYEFWLPPREIDLLAVPEEPSLLGHAPTLLERVRLGREPTRIGVELERGVALELHLDDGVEPWPAESELYLLQEGLWDDSNAWRYLQPLRDLAARTLVVFDAEGRAVLDGLASGRYRFRVHPADVRIEPEVLEVRAGARVTLRWDWLE
jgi:hypothetical protein